MLRVRLSSALLLAGIGLGACDQAINDRYDGLEVVEVVEVVDLRDQPEEQREDLFDQPDEDLSQVNIARPNQRPARMSRPGLASTLTDVPAEVVDEVPVLTLPEEEPETLIALSRPPLRPGDVPQTAGFLLDLGQFANVSPLGERPAEVSNTAEEDQARLTRLAQQILDQEAAEAERLAEEAARAEEEARLAAEQAEAEEAARLQALAELNAEAARQAELDTAAIANTQPAAQGQINTATSIFTPVSFSSADVPITQSSQLSDQFAQFGYDLSRVMAGAPVPNLITQRMPQDMTALGEENRTLMKEVFIKAVLPLCLRSNARIAAERGQYEAAPVQSRAGTLSQSTNRVVRSLSLKYNAENDAALLERLSPVPPSLCLAQAIHDSDWGRNSAVQNQNGLFGSWSRSIGDSAIIAPTRGRDDVDQDTVIFNDLERAVDAYALFLNRHDDLAAFRIRRAQELSIGQVFNGRAASLFMDGFRPAEDAYRDRLLRLIDENDLDQFDLTRLSGTSTAIAVN